MILKFSSAAGGVSLHKYKLSDITTDTRTSFISKKEVTSDKYKVAPGVFVVVQDFFIKMAHVLDDPSVAALYINYGRAERVLIVSSGDHVFIDNEFVECQDYKLPIPETVIKGMIGA